VSFVVLLDAARRQARARVRNGEITERALAARAGISQPYLHNVLKGARQMPPALADRLLKELGLKLEDLLPDAIGPRLRPGSDDGGTPQRRPAAASR
jgi:transcriptional regulator with XRE-family HTH domain